LENEFSEKIKKIENERIEGDCQAFQEHYQIDCVPLRGKKKRKHKIDQKNN
jgi:hypothetical protein